MPLNNNFIASFFENDGRELYFKAENTVDRFSIKTLMEKGVLVGFSGGADSVFLLCFLIEYKRRNNLTFPIHAVHINHGIRGEEADRDEVFCREFCSNLEVEFSSVKYDVPTIAKENHTGLEETARNIRYNAFAEIITGRDDLYSIAVAHNQSDSAETVIFNILRGCGTKGASGIPAVRDNIIRPLVNIKKSEILCVLDKAKVPYVTDSTNQMNDYSRNYIRNEVIPILTRICTDPEKMIARFADNLQCDNEYLESLAEDFLLNNPTVTNKALSDLHPSLFIRVLKLMAGAESVGISARIVEDVSLNLSNDNFSYSLIGGTFLCERGICTVRKDQPIYFDYCVYLSEDVNYIKEINVEALLSDKPFDKTYSNVYKKSIQVDLSSAIINGKAYLRPKKDGDSIYYGGMTHKLKKLFNDRKIPLEMRKKIPVLCDDNGVVWLPGFGVRDDGVPIAERKRLYVLIGEVCEKESL